jgi:hypothetical protein
MLHLRQGVEDEESSMNQQETEMATSAANDLDNALRTLGLLVRLAETSPRQPSNAMIKETQPLS